MSRTTKDNQFRFGFKKKLIIIHSCISGVMIIVLFWSLIDRGFKVRSGQTKENRFGI